MRGLPCVSEFLLNISIQFLQADIAKMLWIISCFMELQSLSFIKTLRNYFNNHMWLVPVQCWIYKFILRVNVGTMKYNAKYDCPCQKIHCLILLKITNKMPWTKHTVSIYGHFLFCNTMVFACHKAVSSRVLILPGVCT